MSWRIKEEHLDAAEGMHRVIYENDAVRTADGKPQQHHLYIFVGLDACPHCGHVPEKNEHGEVDVKALKAKMHARLNEHHEHMVNHAKKHQLQMLNTARR